MKSAALIILLLCAIPLLSGWTKNGTIYTTDGSRSDVQSAIDDSTAGDTINIPAGSFSWGTGGTYLQMTKAVTVAGAGPASTTITITEDAAPGFNGVLRFFAAATFKNVKIVNPSTSLVIFQMGSGSEGWRITNVTSVPNATSAGSNYFAYVNRTYGVIDNCDITAFYGNDELVFSRGHSDAWQQPANYGGTDAIYIESCTFRGPGYVNDANGDAKVVVRFCTIVNDMKVDGHGLASNGSPGITTRGVRSMEVYNNHWTTLTGTGSWTAVELRGGTGMVFNNTVDRSPGAGSFFLTDYGYLGQFGGFFSTYQTPSNYPIEDQVGTGQDTTINATALTQYRYAFIKVAGTTSFTAIGAANNSVGTAFIATGAGTGSGTASYAPASEPMYLWGNQKNSSTQENITNVNTTTDTLTVTAHGIPTATPCTFAWTNPIGGLSLGVTYYVRAVDANTLTVFPTANDATNNTNKIDLTSTGFLPKITPSSIILVPYPRNLKTVDSGAITLYRSQTGDGAATFNEQDIIKKNRDFFATSGFDGTYTFDGSQGVGVGTKAQMNAITPSLAGVGFWVTDEGTWNSTVTAGTSGVLYSWNGSAWVIKYIPHAYPFYGAVASIGTLNVTNLHIGP